MFDLMIPLMANRDSGYSLICYGDGDSHELCYIQLAEGVCLAELMEQWLWEAIAVSAGKRNRGFLPTELKYDREGRLGCKSGLGLVKDGNNVHIYDLGEFRRTYLLLPMEWWRCVEVRRLRPYRVIGTVPLSSFAAWADRLEHVIFNTKRRCLDLKYSCEIKEKNADNMADVLGGIVGGRKLLSVFPADYMDRLECITRYGRGNRGIEINGEVGDCDFNEETYPPRDMEELVWWINMVFRHGDIVAFLDPRCNTVNDVPLFVLKSGDDIAGMLPGILEKSRIDSDAIDHIAFSANCGILELPRSRGHVVLAKAQYRRLLKGASRVLFGVCKGTAWAEFPLGKIVRKPIPPLFAKDAL